MPFQGMFAMKFSRSVFDFETYATKQEATYGILYWEIVTYQKYQSP
ncbi:hypothetical protein [Nitrosopumilus piranensis]|nr:hypothetical protein [Nitrosopumilus piranensis]